MPDRPRAGAAPWITAAALGTVFAVLLVIYLVLLRPEQGKVHAGSLNSGEQAAMSAAGQESANLLSFRRAHFDADFARAVAGATGSFKSDVSGQKAKTLSTLKQGKFDLRATVTHTALVGPVKKGSDTGYTVLVTLNGYKSTSPDVPTQQNLQVTVVREGGKWLVDAVQSVGIS